MTFASGCQGLVGWCKADVKTNTITVETSRIAGACLWRRSTRCAGFPERDKSCLSPGKRIIVESFSRYRNARNIPSPSSAGGTTEVAVLFIYRRVGYWRTCD
jgi:hypothetical protein